MGLIHSICSMIPSSWIRKSFMEATEELNVVAGREKLTPLVRDGVMPTNPTNDEEDIYSKRYRQALVDAMAKTNLNQAGIKYDQSKDILALVPPSLEEAVGAILTVGARKYAPNNWKKGIHYSRIISSLKRHLNEFYKGNLIDEESGKPHLWHAACNMTFLIEFESKPETYAQFNDVHLDKK